MSDELIVLNPTLPAVGGRARLAPRRHSLDGLTAGFLDNGKPNSDRLLALLADRLRERHRLAEVVWARKPSIGQLAPPGIVQDLAARCHLIVTGIGD